MYQADFQRSAISAGDCISNAWTMVSQNYGLFFGISIVGLILAGCIPCVSLFIAGPIVAGIYFVCLKQMRAEQIEFGMMFKGFEVFLPAMVVGIIIAIPEIIGQGVRITINVADISMQGRGSDGRQAALAGGILLLAIGGGLVLFVLGIFLKISLFFALPLIMERGLGVGDAMKLSFSAGWANFGGIIVLSILEGLIALAGVLACFIGVLFVIPIIYAANAFAYRQVFPDMQSPNQYTPPSPAEYGSGFGQGL